MHTFDQVKLIVTDMDGTLLNSDRQLPCGLFEMIRKLKSCGVRFAIGSGRSYPTLAAQFREVQDDLFFIAENGACIVDGQELIHEEALSVEQIVKASDACAKVPDIYPIYSCFHKVYVPESTPGFVKDIIYRFYDPESIAFTKGPETVPEPVCKVTVCAPFGSEAAIGGLSCLKDPVRTNLSGQIWIDIFLDSCSKGSGIRAMQKKLAITSDETMIFGDYLNDLSMVQEAYFSYAMANSHPDFLKACRFTTRSNDENGVMDIMAQVLAAHSL